MAGGERGERDAPAEQLRLVESLEGDTPYVGHEPVAMFHHVARQEHPTPGGRLPDPRGAYPDREDDDRKGKHDEEGYAIPRAHDVTRHGSVPVFHQAGLSSESIVDALLEVLEPPAAP